MKLHGTSQMPAQQSGQRIAPACVDTPNTAQVTEQFPVLEQLRNGAFHCRVTARIASGAQARQSLEHRWGRNYEAGTYSGRQQVGKRADVDDIGIPWTCGDGQDRLALIVELVVVIVFDDSEVMY